MLRQETVLEDIDRIQSGGKGSHRFDIERDTRTDRSEPSLSLL
jgi:hypothetical protein